MPIPIRRAQIAVSAAILLALVVLVIWLLADDEAVTTPPVDAGVTAVDASPKDTAAPDVAVVADAAVDTRKRYWRRITQRRVRRMQRRNSALFSLCFKRAARVSGNLPRKVNVVVQLKPGGAVKSVSVTPSSSAALRQCLVRMIRAWRFPSDSRAQRLDFPIVFAR